MRTLTPTMLFTMFVISPQLEAAAAVIARGLEAREPHPVQGAGTTVGRETLRETGGWLPGGGGLLGKRQGQSTSRPRQTPRPPHVFLPRWFSPATSVSPRIDPEELRGASQEHLSPASQPP